MSFILIYIDCFLCLRLYSLFISDFFFIFPSAYRYIKTESKMSGKGIVLKAYRMNFVDVTISQSTRVCFCHFLFRFCSNHLLSEQHICRWLLPFFLEIIPYAWLYECVVKNVIMERRVNRKVNTTVIRAFLFSLFFIWIYSQWYVINMYVKLACCAPSFDECTHSKDLWW